MVFWAPKSCVFQAKLGSRPGQDLARIWPKLGLGCAWFFHNYFGQNLMKSCVASQIWVGKCYKGFAKKVFCTFEFFFLFTKIFFSNCGLPLALVSKTQTNNSTFLQPASKTMISKRIIQALNLRPTLDLNLGDHILILSTLNPKVWTPSLKLYWKIYTFVFLDLIQMTTSQFSNLDPKVWTLNPKQFQKCGLLYL